MALVTAAIASLFVRGQQAPEEEAQDLFDTQALRLLADIARRLEVIEATIARETPDTPSHVDEPPTGTSD